MLDTDPGDIMELLMHSGLPEESKDCVTIRPNGSVYVSNIENQVCRDLIDNIHGKELFGRKLYCNGVILLTPDKSSDKSSTLPSLPDPISSSTAATAATAVVAQDGFPTLNVISSPTALISDETQSRNVEFDRIPQELLSDEEVVRRHSLSCRTPPKRSLASDILYSKSEGPSNSNASSLDRTRILLDLCPKPH